MLAVGFAKDRVRRRPHRRERALPAARRSRRPAACSPCFLVLRAFASGCTALTGVEAVSNGVPAFEPPKSRNAAATLVMMGAAGDDDVRRHHGARPARARAHGRGPVDADRPPAGREQKTALSQIGLATFGAVGRRSTCCRRFTAAILVLAANTAFNGFPVLVVAARPRPLPPAPALPPRRPARLLQRDRAARRSSSALLIVAFDAEVTRLIQLYILGVFLSFTLSQARHGAPLGAADRAAPRRRGAPRAAPQAGAQRDRRRRHRPRLRRSCSSRSSPQGAWIVVLAAPILFAAMKAIARHYAASRGELAPTAVRRRRCPRASTPSCSSRNLLGADAARARLRPGDVARRRCARSPSPTTASDDPLADGVARARACRSRSS